MTTDAAKLLGDAMRLSEKDRAELAARLIDSLEQPFDDDAEAAWDAELAARIEQLESGKVRPVPWPEARRMILGHARRGSNGSTSD